MVMVLSSEGVSLACYLAPRVPALKGVSPHSPLPASRHQVTLQVETGSYRQTQKIGSDLSGVCTCKRCHTCDLDKKWLAWISIWRWRWIQIWIGVESIDQHSNIDIT